MKLCGSEADCVVGVFFWAVSTSSSTGAVI